MATDKQAAILMGGFDQLAAAPFLAIYRERYDLAQSIIDELGSYPRPKAKGSTEATEPKELAAYLYTSTARNTLKLAQLGRVPFAAAFTLAYECFEAALGILTE